MKKSTIKEFVDRANKIHNNKYDYSKSVYSNSKVKLIIICKKHGEFKQTPNSHLNGQGCKLCGFKLRTLKKTSNLQDFINKVKKIHNCKYGYSKVNYINSKTKIVIICKKHGEFLQTPSDHLYYGCNKCAIELRSNLKRTNLSCFKSKANKIHKNKYNYDNVEFKTLKNKINISCPKHGSFTQSVEGHLNGYGCRKCANKSKSLTKTEFIKKSNKVHLKKYNYSKTNYINSITKVIIICPKHGEFLQIPKSHLTGAGCKKCSIRKSKLEKKWIKEIENNLGYSLLKQYNLKIDGVGCVDGYDPKTNTVYQFHGDFWHGNLNKYLPTDIHPLLKITFKELNYLSNKKDKLIKNSGYNVKIMWEKDFLCQN